MQSTYYSDNNIRMQLYVYLTNYIKKLKAIFHTDVDRSRCIASKKYMGRQFFEITVQKMEQ